MNGLIRISLTVAGLATAIGLAAPAGAHHGYGDYDRDTMVRLEGVITSIKWTNPHVILMVAPDEGPPFRIEWNNVTRLTRAGVAPDSLSVGDRVVISGARNKRPDARIMTLLNSLTRPADGWTWSRPGTGDGSVSKAQDSAAPAL